MLRRTLRVLLVSLGCVAPAAASAELQWSGALRNDALVLGGQERAVLIDHLENQLVLQRRTDAWRFYADVRVDLYAGEAAALVPDGVPEGREAVAVRLLRGFVRYASPWGDWTLGKTYANFGVAGLFNPFEIDRNVQLTDLGYTKEGIVGLTYAAALGPLSGCQVLLSPGTANTEPAAAAGVHTHWDRFDLGWVAQRRGRDLNLTGVYLQGDLEVGVQAAYAFHCDDDGSRSFSEATAGIDYSFWDGQVLASATGSYLEGGAASRGTTVPAFSGASAVVGLGDPTAGLSWHASLQFMPDEFFQARLDLFGDAEDGSGLVVPGATWVLADGLSLTLQGIVPTGTGPTRFSRERLGTLIGLVRVEAKL